MEEGRLEERPIMAQAQRQRQGRVYASRQGKQVIFEFAPYEIGNDEVQEDVAL